MKRQQQYLKMPKITPEGGGSGFTLFVQKNPDISDQLAQ